MTPMRVEHSLLPNEATDESRIWLQLINPNLELPDNVSNLCFYGFSKLLNNAVEHAECHHIIVRGEQNDRSVTLEIEDDGIGIFNKIRTHFNLDSEIHALIELTKGKLTVDPQTHSGEGLFFSSKMFERFRIESGTLSVTFEAEKCSINQLTEPRKGTFVHMEIGGNSQIKAQDVFNQFCDAENLNFYKTRFSILLAAFESNLISRSQAKRVTTRLENFKEVELDFNGVESIGQAFADELLRVWPLKHPQTRVVAINTNEAVRKMINHVHNRLDLPQP